MPVCLAHYVIFFSGANSLVTRPEVHFFACGVAFSHLLLISCPWHFPLLWACFPEIGFRLTSPAREKQLPHAERATLLWLYEVPNKIWETRCVINNLERKLVIYHAETKTSTYTYSSVCIPRLNKKPRFYRSESQPPSPRTSHRRPSTPPPLQSCTTRPSWDTQICNANQRHEQRDDALPESLPPQFSPPYPLPKSVSSLFSSSANFLLTEPQPSEPPSASPRPSSRLRRFIPADDGDDDDDDAELASSAINLCESRFLFNFAALAFETTVAFGSRLAVPPLSRVLPRPPDRTRLPSLPLGLPCKSDYVCYLPRKV